MLVIINLVYSCIALRLLVYVTTLSQLRDVCSIAWGGEIQTRLRFSKDLFRSRTARRTTEALASRINRDVYRIITNIYTPSLILQENTAMNLHAGQLPLLVASLVNCAAKFSHMGSVPPDVGDASVNVKLL
jgi:hypothetical protein